MGVIAFRLISDSVRRVTATDAIRVWSANPTNQNRRTNRQLSPPGRKRQVGTVNESGIREFHWVAILIPAGQCFPKPFAKTEDNSEDVAHFKIFDGSLLLWRQFRNKSHSSQLVRTRLQHAQRQRDDGARCRDRTVSTATVADSFNALAAPTNFF